MEHTLLRYNSGMAVDQSQEHPSDEQKAEVCYIHTNFVCIYNVDLYYIDGFYK